MSPIDSNKIIENWNALASLQKGEKPEVPADGKFTPSAGNNEDWSSWAVQGITRTFRHILGVSAADHTSVFKKVDELINDSNRSLDTIEEQAKRVNDAADFIKLGDQYLQLQEALKNSKNAITTLQKTYQKNEDAMRQLQPIMTRVENLQQRILSGGGADQAMREAAMKMREPLRAQFAASPGEHQGLHQLLQDAQLQSALASVKGANPLLASLSIFERSTNPGDGTGPSAVEQSYAIVRTGREILRGFTTQATSDDVNQKDLECRGKQLRDGIMSDLLPRLSQMGEFTYLDFLQVYPGKSTTSDQTLQSIRENLEFNKRYVDASKPVVIPIVMGGGGILDSRHIACILIKGKEVIYYDAKGVTSENRSLKDGKSFRDILDLCNEQLLNGKGEIVDKMKSGHQYDCHNCGAYVLHFVFQVLFNGKDMDYLAQREIPIKHIHYFREHIKAFVDANIPPEDKGYSGDAAAAAVGSIALGDSDEF